jgi:hypothetical protein
MAIAHYMYDSNGDMTPDMQYPNCATLPQRSAATTTDFDDAADWGCQLRANSQFTGTHKTHNPARDNVRLPKQLEMELVRHTMN